MSSLGKTRRGSFEDLSWRGRARRALVRSLPAAQIIAGQGRAFKRRTSYHAFRLLAGVRPIGLHSPDAYVFVIGCGRSGTTLLGEMIAQDRRVRYYFEPWSRWAAVNPATDASGLIVSDPEGLLTLDGSDASDRQADAFRALFRAPRNHVVVEKTPRNALRIAYLDSLAPKARFIHIVRDGVDVSRSIEAAALDKSGSRRGNVSPWWGRDDSKWELLRAEARANGYPTEWCLQDLDHVQRAALEWTYTVNEVERRRESLGERLLGVRYSDLLATPIPTLARLYEHIGLEPDQDALRRAAATVRHARGSPRGLFLPAAAAEMFNEAQRRHGFANLAEPIET